MIDLEKPDFRPLCECETNDGSERIIIFWEEWLSLKAHYPKAKILRQECYRYPHENYSILEQSKNWKIITYD